MEIKVEKKSEGKIKFTINLSPAEMVKYFNKSYAKISSTIKLDGFRPGKAPRKLIESAAGLSRLLSSGLDLAVSDSYQKALKENSITPITSPNVVIVKYPNYGVSEEEVKENFEFEVEIEAIYDVSLNDYSDVKIKKPPLKKATKKEIEKVLEHFSKQNATFSEVRRGAQKGDRIEIDFDGYIKRVKIDQMCSKNHPIIIGDNTLIPGFEDELIGLKKGDSKTFKIKFPQNYHAKEYAGKDAEFEVRVRDLKEVALPVLDHNFAQKFGHNNMSDLKNAIELNLNLELEQEHRRSVESMVFDALIPKLNANIPNTLIEREAERILFDFSEQIKKQGLNIELYLKNIGKTKEEFTKEMWPQATKNIQIGFIMGQVIEKNKWDQNDKKIGGKVINYLINKLTS